MNFNTKRMSHWCLAIRFVQLDTHWSFFFFLYIQVPGLFLRTSSVLAFFFHFFVLKWIVVN